ncbi:Ankyrin repeat-like protein [Magnetococcus marinus MC-1]|uniref:Ankyrin repeat-like protein n=1 Tax=Magnetococcus marinus (strain ATCC BAA-1437 / JCM 17883 / MC-1) TaxID=156889 RepID=A0L850_MAGMM|nr:ankyrin repeat domain-containing protein [Magnetococcus marinus]ABK44143.1 Ankyrin repeat-like protein [Magnetococcus marinus MC-1]
MAEEDTTESKNQLEEISSILFEAVLDAELIKKLKEKNNANILIDELKNEFGGPRLLWRPIYWWILVPGFEKGGKALQSSLKGFNNRMLKHLISYLYSHKEKIKGSLKQKLSDLTESNAQLVDEDPKADLEEFKQFLGDAFKDLSSAVEKALAQGQSPLPLSLKIPVIAGDELTIYWELRARTSPFRLHGRESNLDSLDAFLCERAIFSWWVIKGGGGLGKTRLVLDFIKDRALGWHAGFLDSLAFDWAGWCPTMPTLIVVDYASTHGQDLFKTFLLILAGMQNWSSPLDFPVRVLLIERSFPDDLKNLKIDPLWQDMGSQSDFDFLTQSFHSKQAMSLELLPLKESCWVIQDVSHRADVPVFVTERLEEDEQLRRPLFLTLIGQALRKGNGPTNEAENINLDIDDLIESSLASWERCPWLKKNFNDGLYASILVLWMTITRSENYSKAVGHLFKHEIFNENVDMEASKAIAANLVGASSRGNFSLPPLEPDILGEFFSLLFLEHVRSRNMMLANKLREALLDLADLDQNEQEINQVVSFFTRLAQDTFRPIINKRSQTLLDIIDWLFGETVSQKNGSSRLDFKKYIVENCFLVACIQGCEAIVEKFISLFNHESASEAITKGLNVAIFSGRDDILKYLLEEGADATLAGAKGYAPLHIAAALNKLACAEALLGSGKVELDARGSHSSTALHLAVMQGHVEMVKLLLAVGADATLADEIGNTPLHVAAFKNELACAEALLGSGKVDVDARAEHILTALNMAVMQGHVEMVKLLLAVGADATLADEAGQAPLNVAAGNNELACAAALLIYGKVNVDARAEHSGTALNMAVIQGHVEMVKLLLAVGADATLADEIGNTPLHNAAINNELACAEALLGSGKGDVDARAEHILTALNMAVIQGHVEMVKLLLAVGADATLADEFGNTPLHNAAINNELACAEALLGSGKGDVDARAEHILTALNMAVIQGHVEMVKLLLEKGADATLADEDGNTPLHVAAIKNELVCAEALLASGKVDVDARGNHSRTALNMAVRKGHVEMVKLLLEKGADPNSEIFSGSCLHLAIFRGHEEVVSALLCDPRTDIHKRDEDNMTPLTLSQQSGNQKIAQLLLDASRGMAGA